MNLHFDRITAWTVAFLTWSAGLAGAGCTSDTEPPPPAASTSSSTGGESSSTGTGEATGFDGGQACERSEDCETDGACVAAYDPGLGEPGPATCVNTCIATDDLTRWCVDDQACCAGLWCSAVDGFCVAAADDSSASGSGSGSDDGGSESGSSSSGSSSGESTGSSGSTDDSTG